MTTKKFIEVTEWTCARCKITKPIDQFYRCINSRTGHEYSCKQCLQTRAKQITDPDAVKAVKENRNYYTKREVINGRTIVKFGNLQPAFHRSIARPTIQSSLSSHIPFNSK